MDDLYTEPVKKWIYQFKALLPKDFSLTTAERAIYSELHDTIIIVVDSKQFDWRTVEDKLQIAITLERLKQAITDEGVPCLIEKPGQE